MTEKEYRVRRNELKRYFKISLVLGLFFFPVWIYTMYVYVQLKKMEEEHESE